MTKDNDYIAALYKDLEDKDFFTSEDTCDFVWDEYFHEASELNLFSTLIETHEMQLSELSDSCFIKTLDQKEFNVVISYEENGPEVSCCISVQDLNKNLLDVKQSKIMSFELFSALKLSFLNSFVERGYNLHQMTKIAFEISEQKDERLITFYEKLVLKHFPDFNQTSFEEISEKHYINLFATK